MSELPLTVVAEGRDEIVDRIGQGVAVGAVTDFQNDTLGVGFVLQVVRGTLGWKACNHARPELDVPIVDKEGRLSRENVDEFILPRVPMMQRGDGAWRKPRQVHAKNCSIRIDRRAVA